MRILIYKGPGWGQFLTAGIDPLWQRISFLFEGAQVRINLSPDGKKAVLWEFQHECKVPSKDLVFAEILPYTPSRVSSEDILSTHSFVRLEYQGGKRVLTVGRSSWLSDQSLGPKVHQVFVLRGAVWTLTDEQRFVPPVISPVTLPMQGVLPPS